MPWYAPWSDHIAKRVCKYLLQRYLGQYLEEKLSLDQLNIDLYKGIGTIKDVTLDVLALNDLAEQQKLPFEFSDGFIDEMSVSIPWTSLLSESSDIKVTGLTLTLKYKERDKSKVSMLESMWSSMSSSMQLAEDCLRNQGDGGTEPALAATTEDSKQSFEGIERFAHTIDSILSRIRVKFYKSVIRLEEVVSEGVSGVAIEANIEYMEYWDEAGERPVDENAPPEFIVPAISTKHFVLEGVSFLTDEFKPHRQRERSHSDSFPFSDEFESAHESLHRSTDSSSTMGESGEGCENSCVLMGKLAGRQEITVQFKHEAICGPKVEMNLRLGALTLFLSPRQVHKLIHLVKAMGRANQDISSGKKSRMQQKPMDESDFRKIENELLTGLNQGSLPTHALAANGWANDDSMDESSEFMPLKTWSSRYNESVVSSTSSLGSSTSSLNSSRSSLSTPSYLDPRQSQTVDVDTSSALFRFQVSLCSVAVVLLHDDILVLPVPGVGEEAGPATAASLQAMRAIADQFFAKLGHFAISGFGNKDFQDAKKVFLNACQYNHLRFLAAPVIIEGSETAARRGSVFNASLSAASLQLLECLVEKNVSSEPVGEYIEIITFTRSRDDKSLIFDALPSLKLDFKLYDAPARRDKGRRINQSRSELSLVLQPMEIDFDITIIDRIATVLAMESISNRNKSNSSRNKPEINIQQAVDNTVKAGTKHCVQVAATFVIFKLRFPVPDLRPLHDMERAPWWRRHVRPETLILHLTDFSFLTTLDPLNPVLKYEIQCRNLTAHIQEAEHEPAAPFVSIGADPSSNTIHDGGRGFGWPRLVLTLHPLTNNIDLTMPEPPIMGQSMGHMSLIAALERTQKREVSPFSFQKVINDGSEGEVGEELVTPATKEEVSEFIELASNQSCINIQVFCPTASLLLPSKRLYELIYNRLTMDLLMWKSSAPARETPATQNLSLSEDSLPHTTFNLCKSAIHYESDSDESQDGLFFSMAEQKERYHKKKAEESSVPHRQSRISVCLSVGQGLCDLYLPVRDSQGNIIPERSGELVLAADEVTYFYVSGFNGKRDLDYMCVQSNHVSLHHNGLLTEGSAAPALRSIGCSIPHYLLPTICRMDRNACPEPCDPVGVGSAQSLDMLSAAVKVSRDENNRSLKTFRVALGMRNSCLRYRVCESRNSWYNQMIDLFDVDDYPIAGYEPSTVITELNLHLWNCNIDYRPLYLPLRSVLNLNSFNLSSNIASKTHSSTLRLIAEDASLFLSEKMGHRPQSTPVNLQKDYVCVIQLGLFELFVRLCEISLSNPKVDLRTSANGLVVATCSDSAKALLELLTYFASDGDICGVETEAKPAAPPKSIEPEEVLVNTSSDEPAPSLSKSQVERVHDLMEEAMLDSRPGAIAFFTPDAAFRPPQVLATVEAEGTTAASLQLGSEIPHDYELDDNWENDFCMLENEAGIGILPKSGLPEVRQLTPDPPRLVDNHFALPTGRTDHLRSPRHYPRPVARYTLRELSLVWQMFGGSDFDPPPPPKHVNIQQPLSEDEKVAGTTTISFSKSSPSSVRFEVPLAAGPVGKLNWRERGGLARRQDVLMELQLSKVQFQHEVYPPNTAEASRQVLLIKDLEVRDRLATSQINKFLYQYYSEAKPKQAHAHMVVVKALHIRADPKMNSQECCLKVSLLPLRFNIDQDSLLFLVQFFSEISGEKEDEEDPAAAAAAAVSSRHSTPTHVLPVMSVTSSEATTEQTTPVPAPPLIQLEDPRPTPRTRSRPKRVAAAKGSPSQPVFFTCVIFSPEVPVKLDYQGKHVDLTHGPLAGILMGLGQLNNSELRLKRIAHKHGLLGFDKLVQFALNEWSTDMKRNQLPGLLGGVGPMHSLVQLFQGIRDLFWLPIEQYQKDGRLVRGIQRGANSFTTSSAMAVLELTSRLIQIIQSTAETAYDMVSPGPSVHAQRQQWRKEKKRPYSQPADIREGVANAILVVKDGIGEAAVNLVRVASEEHEQKGVTGAVGGVLRQIPPTVVKPIILASEATNSVIGGMRSQLMPDARKEAVDKWRGHT